MEESKTLESSLAQHRYDSIMLTKEQFTKLMAIYITHGGSIPQQFGEIREWMFMLERDIFSHDYHCEVRLKDGTEAQLDLWLYCDNNEFMELQPMYFELLKRYKDAHG